ncbi:hypothetical protein AWZ03_007201 [Drosophila navojoa]|uniref:Uncharacterized protein n=1 Tax=Drosophila navojoa TaxID=7232 RepID=A0A484BC51_DRONA|nr:hypothetical protein AWZ03_007201 [Drosophila navojoa]
MPSIPKVGGREHVNNVNNANLDYGNVSASAFGFDLGSGSGSGSGTVSGSGSGFVSDGLAAKLWFMASN